MAFDAVWWRGKRVLITGHTGFKGAWCCLWLHRLGAQLRGYALEPDTTPDLFGAADVASTTKSVIADIRDRERLRGEVARFDPQIIIHMAAQPLVRVSYDRPLETYAVNVVGTANVLEAVRAAPSARAIVVVTSDKCYDLHGAERAHAEEDALGGADPYSASKAGAELVTAGMRVLSRRARESTIACGIATARAGNTIGGGDWARDRLMPDLIASFIKGEPALIRNPAAVRPWQHILDPLYGYLLLARRLWEQPEAFSQPWNLGPPDSNAQSVASVADAAAARFGNGARWRVDEAGHPPEAGVLRLDSSKAKARLGWSARLDLGSAIDWSVGWYRSFALGDSARALVEADIARYEALVAA
ncbi:MAG TPA: CDP-glucose 4,6-dehydratase [Candidatus Eremiobacteraceae bacterium]|nr:CDP-glucose 4,6-dehydratase [Candidatus Eremiobacteraceae bacterium]